MNAVWWQLFFDADYLRLSRPLAERST